MGCRPDKPDPVWAPLHRLQDRSGLLHLLWHGVRHGLQVDVCSTVVLRGLRGNHVPHHDLLQGTLLWHLEYLLPSFCFPFCLQGCVLNFFSSYSSVLSTAVLPLLSILKYLSPLGLRGSAVPLGGRIGAGCTQCWATPASSQKLP